MMDQNNDKDINIISQSHDEQQSDNQNSNNVAEIFNEAKENILKDKDDKDLANYSIQNIDQNIDSNINNIKSFEDFKKDKENEGINDEEVLKHLYFNYVAQEVCSSGLNSSNNRTIYFQTKDDYNKLATHLQAKTLEIINSKNNGYPDNKDNKYLNLKLNEKSATNGDENNVFLSSATIVNDTQYTKKYGDPEHNATVGSMFAVSINCGFNASSGFNCNATTTEKIQQLRDIDKLGVKYNEKCKNTTSKAWKIACIILGILSVILAALAILWGIKYYKKKKEEEEAKKAKEESKQQGALDEHTNVKSTEDTSIKYAQGTNTTRTGKDSNGNKVSVVTDVNDIKYGKDLSVNENLKDATELAAAGEVKNITADGKSYNVLNIDVTKGTGGAEDQYKLTLADGTTKTFDQSAISSVKIGSKEYVNCLDTMENVDVQHSGDNTYFYYNTNDLEANLTTNNPTATAYDENGVAMISTNATSEAGLSMLQQIYDDNTGVQYNARLNTLLGHDWYDKSGNLHNYKTGNLVAGYANKQLNITDSITNDISSYYSGQTKRNNTDYTKYNATEQYNAFTKKYGANYTNKVENGNFDLYDNITTNNSLNTAASYNLNSTYKERTNCLFA